MEVRFGQDILKTFPVRADDGYVMANDKRVHR